MDVATVQLQGALADRGAWQATRCSIDKALGVVGTRSALLLMREAFYGTRRFDDFAHRVGITEAVAAARLKELVDTGLLDRAPYREGTCPPPGRTGTHAVGSPLADRGSRPAARTDP